MDKDLQEPHIKDLKMLVKQTLVYLKTHNIAPTPESYFEVFCMLAKQFNINTSSCAWFYEWLDKFNPIIKKELNNYPIKTQNDFINVLSAICNNHIKSNALDLTRILNKSLRVLKEYNLIDTNEGDTLEVIDEKLSKILANNQIAESKVCAFKDTNETTSKTCTKDINEATHKTSKDSTWILPSMPFWSETDMVNFDKETYVLLCDICCFEDIRVEFGNDGLEKLFNVLLQILRDSTHNEIIGYYNRHSIIISLPQYTLQEVILCVEKIQSVVDKSEFVYKGKAIQIAINIQIKQIKDLPK